MHSAGRTPAPFINLPVSALTDEIDPTREIRTLINELQTAARDARARLISAERERDDLASQLHHSFQKIEQFRTQFVEISTVLRERDNAMETADRLAVQLRDLEKKHAAVCRERQDFLRKAEDSTRQRDQAVERRDDTIRNANNYAAQLAEVQRQVLSIRQARDTAQAQNLELTARITQLQEEQSEFSYTRDSAQKTAQNAAAEIADLRKQVEGANRERESTSAQIATLQRELDEQRRKVLDLTEEKSAVAEADSEHLVALTEARQQVNSLTLERDAARERLQVQTGELDEMRAQLQDLKEKNLEDIVPAAELEELKRHLASVTADRDLHLEREKEFLAETVSQQDRLAALTEQLSAAQRGREEALTSLTSAQKQIDHIIRDRDAVRQQGIDNSLDIEAQLRTVRAEINAMKKQVAEADQRIEAAQREREDALGKAEQFDKQRLQAIELAAQLDTARRDILSLSADLAEARLLVKSAQASRAAAKAAPAPNTFDDVQTLDISLDGQGSGNGSQFSDDHPVVRPAVPSIDGPVNEQFSTKNAKETLTALKHCLQAFARDQDETSLFDDIYRHAHHFAERASVSGYVALNRVGGAIAELARHLFQVPESITPSVLRTFSQSFDLLGILIQRSDYAQLKDPSKATVYAVDDEADNCEAIRLALEGTGIRTQCTQEPAVALAELAGGRFDLILLDISIPGMDGFELCQHIRQLAIHTTTPIVFVTGHDNVENRVQSSLSGGSDFLGKPFNCCELTLKALTLIAKQSLKTE